MSKKITHEGELVINDIKLPCYVLEDGTRVLSGRGMQDAIKLVEDASQANKKPGGELVRFFNSSTLKPFFFAKNQEKEVERFKPIICYKGRQKIHGYEATVLADICDAMLEARKQGITFTPRYTIVTEQCEILVRAFAKIGIIALVDEATGYQYARERDELQKILKAYVTEELLKWSKKFPDTFYREIFRLNNWNFTVTNIRAKPGVVGKWTNKLIYEQLPSGVLEGLKQKTPKNEAGNYTAKLHQSLTEDIGDPHLQRQINAVVAVMQISDNWQQFLQNFNKMVDRRKGQFELQFEDLEPKPKLRITEELTLFDGLQQDETATPAPKNEDSISE